MGKVAGVQALVLVMMTASVLVTGPAAAVSATPIMTRAASPGTQLWVRRYDGRAHGTDRATSVAVSPDGSAVFVTGYSQGTTSGLDYTTIGYSTATGAVLWVRRYNGSANATDMAWSVAVSPDSSTVFVTGSSLQKPSGDPITTIAYNTATGAVRWLSRYNGAASSGNAIAFSPDGGRHM